MWRGAAVVVSLALAAGGCNFSRTRTPVPASGGEFRVLLAAEPRTLNPLQVQDDSNMVIGQNLFNKLVALDADYRVIKDLAESWEVGDRGATYTFHLAHGVRWHDGTRFTSADVKWTFEALMRRSGVSTGFMSRIASVATPDDATVIVRLKEPWAPFLPYLAWAHTFILPAHRFAGTGAASPAGEEKPAGTGPFRFVAWEAGNRIVLERNPDYFRFRPPLDRLVFRFVPNASEEAGRLFAGGQIDFMIARPRTSEMRKLSQQPGLIVRTRPHPARYYLAFNLRRWPWSDLRARRAVARAVERNRLVETSLLGYGSPAIGFYTPAISWAYNAGAQAPAYDAKAAARLWRQVRGRRPERSHSRFRLLVSINAPYREIAEELAAQLKPAGVAVEVVPLAPAAWHERVVVKRDFDLAVANGTWGPDPDILDFRFGSRGAYQFMGYSNSKFDAPIAEGARGETLRARAQAYARAQEILARDLPIVPLLEHVQFYTYRAGIEGLPQLEALGLVGTGDYSLVRWTK
ncbi:MAG: hypothetical protein HY822_01790 [Acidobacteria bacterium]|nr:hypothetical protein [Acidobacteriota bacterium]